MIDKLLVLFNLLGLVRRRAQARFHIVVGGSALEGLLTAMLKAQGGPKLGQGGPDLRLGEEGAAPRRNPAAFG